jgi:hypothetical protein
MRRREARWASNMTTMSCCQSHGRPDGRPRATAALGRQVPCVLPVVLRRHWHSPCVRTASCAFLQRVRGQRASPASSGTLEGRQAVAARRRGQLCLMQPCVHTGAGAGADNCSARTEASLLHDSRTPSRPLPCRSLAEVKHLKPSTNLSPWLPISRRAGRIAKFMS